MAHSKQLTDFVVHTWKNARDENIHLTRDGMEKMKRTPKAIR